MYSTIRKTKGNCKHPGCGYFGPLISGKCELHYWGERRMASFARLEERELAQNENLSAVIEDLDAVFSQYIRLREADENGYCRCYGCSKLYYWTEMQCCHYIPRAHKNTRFLEENCVCGCKNCNKNDGGPLSSYSEHFGNLIERDRTGGVEALEEQAKIEYNYSVSEIKSLISYYSKEVKRMKAKIPMKN